MVSSPKAPDPYATADAQSQYNQNTAVTQQLLNMTDQVTPYGNVTYTPNGTTSITSPDGKTYQVPRFTQTTTLNPEQQSTLNQTQTAANNIAQTANSLSSSGLSSLGQAVDTSGAPGLQTSLGSGYSSSPGSSYSSTLGNGYSTSLGSGYNTSFGSDTSTEYNNAKNAVMDQLTPTLDRNAEASRAQMAASGVRAGSAAYSANEQTIGDNYTRAANQATETAQSVENQLFNQQEQQAGYTDSALLNAGNYTNSAALNQFNAQNSASLAGQEFSNSAILNNANFDNSANSQWLQNYYQQRDQPLNELSALLSGSQVTNANTATSSTPQTSVAGVDYGSLVNQQYQNAYQKYQNEMSGISSAGTGLLSFL
ncbi:hypothetical protein [Acetobacter cerevisiae]|uniref:hypothetical protein n=1 Tax=Acetobacter cerevisiae TaxID=178900 RepID=UPI00209D208F|nr:hypothetical protein [Acetobacter cerevisiae]MCP1270572.1 hypothetical protein [Acetobacter cerevisiae]MCP1278526.1 hypothetical protein [Acetobacter cerevisiae]